LQRDGVKPFYWQLHEHAHLRFKCGKGPREGRVVPTLGGAVVTLPSLTPPQL